MFFLLVFLLNIVKPSLYGYILHILTCMVWCLFYPLLFRILFFALFVHNVYNLGNNNENEENEIKLKKNSFEFCCGLTAQYKIVIKADEIKIGFKFDRTDFGQNRLVH